MKSGNLNFLEPSGPLQDCNGTALAFPVVLQENKVRHDDRYFEMRARVYPRAYIASKIVTLYPKILKIICTTMA
jgi:hypothetical protein